MKKFFLSSAIALVALASFTLAFSNPSETTTPTKKVAKFDRPHFTELCYDTQSGQFQGKVAGLGTNDPANYSISITGTFACDNPADKRPPAWQNLSITGIPLQSSDNSGSYTFEADFSFNCPNSQWTPQLNATASIVSGSRSFDRSSVPLCQ